MKAAKIVGRVGFYRGKGAVWLEVIRPWLLPVLGGGAALKYLGLSATWAIGAMVVFGLVMESAAVLIGWLEHRSGATEEHYRTAALVDPYKSGALAPPPA